MRAYRMVPNNKVQNNKKMWSGPPGRLSENFPVCYFYKVCTKDCPRRNFARLALSPQSLEVCDLIIARLSLTLRGLTSNGKRQMKLLPSVSLNRRVKISVFVPNSRRHFSIFMWFNEGLEEKNTNSEVIFAGSFKRLPASSLDFTAIATLPLALHSLSGHFSFLNERTWERERDKIFHFI